MQCNAIILSTFIGKLAFYSSHSLKVFSGLSLNSGSFRFLFFSSPDFFKGKSNDKLQIISNPHLKPILLEMIVREWDLLWSVGAQFSWLGTGVRESHGGGVPWGWQGVSGLWLGSKVSVEPDIDMSSACYFISVDVSCVVFYYKYNMETTVTWAQARF